MSAENPFEQSNEEIGPGVHILEDIEKSNHDLELVELENAHVDRVIEEFKVTGDSDDLENLEQALGIKHRLGSKSFLATKNFYAQMLYLRQQELIDSGTLAEQPKVALLRQLVERLVPGFAMRKEMERNTPAPGLDR